MTMKMKPYGLVLLITVYAVLFLQPNIKLNVLAFQPAQTGRRTGSYQLKTNEFNLGNNRYFNLVDSNYDIEMKLQGMNMNDVGSHQLKRISLDSLAKKSNRLLQKTFVRYVNLLKVFRKRFSKTLVVAMFMITMFSSTIAFAAPSGGRMGGGSFKSSGGSRSPSMSRSYSSGGRSISSPQRRSQSSRAPMLMPRMSVYYQQSSPYNSVTYFSGGHPKYPASSTLKDMLLLAGAGSLIAYGVTKNAYRQGDDNVDNYGPAAGGATIASVTVALNVPSKNSPDSITSKLRNLSETSNTNSKRGLQDLVTAVTIELARQESSIFSASANAKHYRILGQAEREFQLLSVRGRSKVDRLTINKFGSENRPDNRRISSGREGLGGPTKAIVTLNVAIEGNMVGKPLKISSRQELMTLLSSIGSDVQLEDNELLSAEILWSPEDPSDELLQDEIYSQYPELLLI